MTIQIKKTASEQTLLVSKSINKSNKFFVDLLYNSDLSPAVKSEIKSFIKRNKIIKNEFCSNCVKAHLIKIARLNMDVISALTIEETIPNEIGHQGYYLDAERLVKI